VRSSLKRSTITLTDQVVAPRVTTPRGASCMTCGKLVDREELVEGYPGESTFARVVVACHGAEELRTFQFESTNWDNHDLQQFYNSANFFDPTSHADAPLGEKAQIPNEDDRLSAEYSKRLVSIPAPRILAPAKVKVTL